MREGSVWRRADELRAALDRLNRTLGRTCGGRCRKVILPHHSQEGGGTALARLRQCSKRGRGSPLRRSIPAEPRQHGTDVWEAQLAVVGSGGARPERERGPKPPDLALVRAVDDGREVVSAEPQLQQVAGIVGA